MTSNLLRWLARTAAVAAFALSPQYAWAAEGAPCASGSGRGFGGTGNSDERGFGGTGNSDERGFGGTGERDERGSSDTGVFGTITGFGSLCVNGLSIRYDESTHIDRAGEPSAAVDLRRGQTVLVDATREDGDLRAVRISVQPAVTGPVTRVDAAGGRFEVMLQVVDVPHDVERASGVTLDQIAPGDRLSVHGLLDADGHIRATRFEAAAEGARTTVVGTMRSLPNGALAIGRLLIRGDIATDIPPGPARVTGDWVASDAAMVSASAHPVLDFAPETHLASVEAWVSERDADRLATPLLDIETARSVVHPEPPQIGSRVWAFGSLSAGGVLDAQYVEVDPIGGGAVNPPEWELEPSVGDRDDHDDEDDGDHGAGDDADDGPDIDDLDDDASPDLDDEGVPDIDDGGIPDIDDGGIPDIDDGGIPDIDDAGELGGDS
ncbi:MAG: DUF5666 domain-containing protein [Myxococcota bacterium]